MTRASFLALILYFNESSISWQPAVIRTIFVAAHMSVITSICGLDEMENLEQRFNAQIAIFLMKYVFVKFMMQIFVG